MTKHIQLVLLLALGAVYLAACCEPSPRKSQPIVITTTYSDSSVYDVFPTGLGTSATDSGYYPIYHIDVKNGGVESDTFTLLFSRQGLGFSISQFVPSGQTVTFKTPGPIKDTADITAQDIYRTFFVRSTDSINIKVMRPTLAVRYGGVYNGPEGCNSDPIQIPIDIDAFR
ncbi:MAG: hypothetical protein ABI444_01280 [Candidatus Kapaibacterium sp.]|jgi:hypothetical protein